MGFIPALWLVEPVGLVESLLPRLEGMLDRDLPKEIEAKLNQLKIQSSRNTAPPFMNL